MCSRCSVRLHTSEKTTICYCVVKTICIFLKFFEKKIREDKNDSLKLIKIGYTYRILCENIICQYLMTGIINQRD